jgi:hypothetical protein
MSLTEWLQGTCTVCGRSRTECSGNTTPQRPVALNVDLSPAEVAIHELFWTIKNEVEEPDGSWPGADVVDVLSAWFTKHGFDVDSNSRTEENSR